jgi:O-antigen/teichoic acid export membrane protein
MSRSDSQPVSDLAASGASPAHRIARNGAIVFLSVGIFAVLTMVGMAVLARRLDQRDFGTYAILFAVMQIVQMVLDGGISTIVTARMTRAGDRWRPVVAEALALLVLTGLACVAIMIAVGAAYAFWREDPDLLPLFAIAGLGCAGFHGQQMLAGVFRAFERFEYEAIPRVLQIVVQVGLVAVLVQPGPYALEVAVWITSGSYLFAALVMAVSLHWRWRCLDVRFSPAALVGWVVESIPLGIGDILRRLTLFLDIVLLSVLQTSDGAVAIYKIASSPLAGLNLLPRAVLAVTFPSFTRMALGSREGLARAFARSTRVLWVVCLPMAIFLFAWAGPIASLLGGENNLAAAEPMRVLAWCALLLFLAGQFRFIFTAMGEQRKFVKLVAAVFVIKTGLEVVLICVGGYMGLSVGFFLGEMALVAGGLFYCHLLGLRGFEWDRIARAVPAALVLGVILWFTQDLGWAWLLATAVGGMILYGLLCVLAGALRMEELEGPLRGLLVRFGGRQPVESSLASRTASGPGGQGASSGG